MLHINDLTYRIDGRVLFDKATAAIPKGHKVGLIGRNGAGKSTLLRLISGDISPESGSVTLPKKATMGQVAQEAPGTQTSLIDFVLEAHEERHALTVESETATDPHRIAEIQTRLADMGAHSMPAKAAAILAGLGFPEENQARPCSDYSGGWRMRVALAAMLFSEPDILLLDEPTNYLDLEGAIWLESFLRSYPYTVIIVSHDRDLLNRSVTGILHLDQFKLTYYSGGFERFERQRRENLMQQMSQRKKQEDARRHMEAFVERFKAKASKAKQAQSRVKALEKMAPPVSIVEERIAPFHFPFAERALASPIIRMEKASVSYEEGKPILRNLDLRIDQDDRIALLGANGNGKSTFAKLVADRLKTSDGNLFKHKKLNVAYIAQHNLDELNADDTPYEAFRALMPDATIAQVRAKAGFYGFGANKADTKILKLSGGEKARLLFAIATYTKPHVLILDEPTNHLDMEARDALMLAVNDFEGAVILISHDRHLIEACAERLWLVADGSVTPWEDDLDAYTRWLLDPARKRGPMSESKKAKAKAEGGDSDKKVARQAAADRRKARAPLKKKADEAGLEVERIAGEVAKFDRRLANPKLFQQEPEKAKRFARGRANAQKALDRAEEKWMQLLEAFEDSKKAL